MLLGFRSRNNCRLDFGSGTIMLKGRSLQLGDKSVIFSCVASEILLALPRRHNLRWSPAVNNVVNSIPIHLPNTHIKSAGGPVLLEGDPSLLGRAVLAHRSAKSGRTSNHRAIRLCQLKGRTLATGTHIRRNNFLFWSNLVWS